MLIVGCGGGSGGSSGHPDTGAGAGQVPPTALPDCAGLCARFSFCAIALCNEDTHSTMYTGSHDFDLVCAASCNDAALQAISSSDWQCLFQSSCRQVFEHGACHQQAGYSCS